MQALSLLPQKFKEELAGFGLKVIITPTILEILPTLDFDLSACFGIDQMQVEKMASCWPTVYLPPTKTIYIFERWEGSKGNTVTYSVLNRCALAFQQEFELSAYDGFLAAINADFDCVPRDLMPATSSYPGEFYAQIFSAVVMSDMTKDGNNRMHGITLVFPRTADFIRQALKEFQ